MIPTFLFLVVATFIFLQTAECTNELLCKGCYSSPRVQGNNISISSSGSHSISPYAVNTNPGWYTFGYCPGTPNPPVSFITVSTSESNGRYIIAADAYDPSLNSPGTVYISSDYGKTFTLVASSNNLAGKAWYSVDVSDIGDRMVGAVYQGGIYLSVNSGLTWVQTSALNCNWWEVVCSNDCSIMYATCYNGNIYVTTDSGKNWLPKASVQAWTGVQTSSSGTIAFAVVSGGSGYITTNTGVNWNQISSTKTTSGGTVPNFPSTNSWTDCYISATGQYMYAIANSRSNSCPSGASDACSIYQSIDYGVTWVRMWSGLYFTSVTCSNSGQYIIVLVSNYGIIASNDFGRTATLVYPSRDGLMFDIAMSLDAAYIYAVSRMSSTYSSDGGKIFMDVSLPTSQPSMQPTSNPSNPSSQPSRQPSAQPSRQPTAQPNMKPSSRPSRQPTSQPSSQPSRQPSRQPSMQPSLNPIGPSAQPSRQPSSQPSAQPTFQPSLQPNSKPSFYPSNQPSRLPTMQPSKQPFSRPSMQPTMQPSNRPSSLPSYAPNAYPSRHPSGHPTSHPSPRPSSQPTVQPSSQPTSTPTSEPSSTPSSLPTGAPSSRPTPKPTPDPSMGPTPNPSPQPSFLPSPIPSATPTEFPTTTSPSFDPTFLPSLQPTISPSFVPTYIPSAHPTNATAVNGASKVPSTTQSAAMMGGIGVAAFIIFCCIGAIYYNYCRREKKDAKRSRPLGMKEDRQKTAMEKWAEFYHEDGGTKRVNYLTKFGFGDAKNAEGRKKDVETGEFGTELESMSTIKNPMMSAGASRVIHNSDEDTKATTSTNVNISTNANTSNNTFTNASANTSANINTSSAATTAPASSIVVFPQESKIPGTKQSSVTVTSHIDDSSTSKQLPPNWKEKVDPSSGTTLYINKSTKQTQWDFPTSSGIISSYDADKETNDVEEDSDQSDVGGGAVSKLTDDDASTSIEGLDGGVGGVGGGGVRANRRASHFDQSDVFTSGTAALSSQISGFQSNSDRDKLRALQKKGSGNSSSVDKSNSKTKISPPLIAPKAGALPSRKDVPLP